MGNNNKVLFSYKKTDVIYVCVCLYWSVYVSENMQKLRGYLNDKYNNSRDIYDALWLWHKKPNVPQMKSQIYLQKECQTSEIDRYITYIGFSYILNDFSNDCCFNY